MPSRYRDVAVAILFLATVLSVLFWRSFLPEYVHFSNDAPLGAQSVAFAKLPEGFTGEWNDLILLGFNSGTAAPTISVLLRWWLGALGYAKFFIPVALLLLGTGAWTFFRALKLSPLAALLGGLATMLSAGYFAGACWGVASAEIAVGFNFLALALVTYNEAETSRWVRFLRLALAGVCVGVNVMEAADIGALCSIFVAGYVFYKSLVDGGGTVALRAARGVGKVVLIAAFAGLIAVNTVVSLVGDQGLAGSGGKSAETPLQHWDWATQWSLPKKETLAIVVPGLFGYRMDTPNGGVYWGGVGRTPEIDRFFDSGTPGDPPQVPGMMMRFGYAGFYCGILVVLVALWSVAQVFRRQDDIFSGAQKKLIYFWLAAFALALPLAWGRFAPGSGTPDGPLFYALLYKIPHFSDIRNPAKFLIFTQWALAVLFAYGIDALNRRYLVASPVKGRPIQWDGFDRRLVFGLAGVAAAAALGWLVYSAQKPQLIQYLQKVGFGDENFSRDIAGFSIGQAGWLVFLLAGASGLIALTAKGFFSGPRAKAGAVLLGAFLIFDLGRANLPFVIHWDYKHKYEVGELNPILEILRDKSYEHRVVGLPENPQSLRGYDNYFGGSGIYRIEWTQHHFLYYNIQCLDVIQMPRAAADIKAFLGTFAPRPAREWQLTNTRYILAAAGYLDALNLQLDPVQRRFHIKQRFDITPKPGVTQVAQLEDLTAVASPDGDLALFEFTGALPRAKLYSRWETVSAGELKDFSTNGLGDFDQNTLAGVGTNGFLTLKKLAAPDFDPEQTVLLSAPLASASAATNQNAGTVEFTSYSPKHIVLAANAAAPSVLLLNDHYDPNWRVTVDGQPAALLRCNFLMRGVAVPAGRHKVEFNFSLPNRPFYITLASLGAGLLLAGLLFAATRKNRPAQP